MEFWLRSATLQIGPKRFSMDDLNFSFEIPFEDSEELAHANITVYNLNESSRNSIRRGDAIIVNGGYEGDIGALFIGKVAGLSHKREPADWVTKIIAAPALSEWLNSQVNKTYQKNTRARAILMDLLALFGLEVGQLQLVKDITYPRGKVCKGKLKDVLTEMIAGDCKSRFLIRQNQVIVSDPESGDERGYVLSGATGLLASNEDQTILQVETPQTTRDTNEQKEEKEQTIKRQCLLNYHLGPGMALTIQSRSLNGRFLLVRGSHVGSRTGDWKTNIEVRPLSL